LLEELLVELAAGDDDAIDADDELLDPPLELSAARNSAVDPGVDVGEELELAHDGLGERALADDEYPLRRREAPPEAAEQGTEEEREPQHYAPDDQPVVRARSERRERHEEEGQERSAAQHPDDEPRQLVDRQVTQRAVVAVVEPGELRRHDPD